MEKAAKISIIIPTYQEAGNIPALAGRLYAAAAGRFDLEMIIVDVFNYDALGRRIEKIEYSPGGNTTTRYYYDGWKVLTETDAGQSRQRDYVYGNYLDEVVMIVDPCQAGDVDRYLTQDHLYSPVAILDDSGTILERYEYDAYGTRHVFDDDFTDERTTSDYDLTIAFTGQRLDTLGPNGLELMYYKNRYYQPQFGRFISRDPIGERTGICVASFSQGQPVVGSPFSVIHQYNPGPSLYQYVQSNPAKAGDIYGLKKEEQVCCKIKQQHEGTYIGYQGGYGWSPGDTTCTQETIPNIQGGNPKGVCKCAYKDRKDITVYDAYDGPCCWCTVSLVWDFIHVTLLVECDKKSNWSWDFSPQNSDKEWGKWQPFYSPKAAEFDSTPSSDLINSKWKETLCRVSCDKAGDLKDQLRDYQENFTPSANCQTMSRILASKICGGCP